MNMINGLIIHISILSLDIFFRYCLKYSYSYLDNYRPFNLVIIAYYSDIGLNSELLKQTFAFPHCLQLLLLFRPHFSRFFITSMGLFKFRHSWSRSTMRRFFSNLLSGYLYHFSSFVPLIFPNQDARITFFCFLGCVINLNSYHYSKPRICSSNFTPRSDWFPVNFLLTVWWS